MSSDRSYRETIDYLYALQKHGVKLALANTIMLMEILGNPHRRFRSIHVAGTNGKGSTCAFLASILAAAGYRVGLYTSPHLVSFTERIRINSVPITEEKVVELAQRVRTGYRGLLAGGSQVQPTFFEVTTAIAFAYFAEEKVDVAVVEVGMGGRLDSTNVITPLVSVITNIDLEHMEFLGETLQLIAAEKAGIVKSGVPVVTGVRQAEVQHVINRAAEAARGVSVYLLDRDFRTEPGRDEGRFNYRGMQCTYEDLTIPLLGSHQRGNACLALAALECVRSAGISVDEQAVRTGLAHARWEGRLELVSEKPAIYLDGAHNPASARVLAAAVWGIRSRYRRLLLVIGILGDKDYRSVLAALVPLADHVIVTRPDYARAMNLSVLLEEARKLHSRVERAETVADAIRRARENAAGEDCILITGSLYVVGDARSAIFAGPRQGLSELKG